MILKNLFRFSKIIFDCNKKKEEINKLEISLLDKHLWKNPTLLKKTLQEKKCLEHKIDKINIFRKEQKYLLSIINICKADDDIYQESKIALSDLLKNIKSYTTKSILYNPLNEKKCFLEIHSGAGGIDSNDWANMLFRMYNRWLQKKKWTFSVIDSNITESGGIKSIIIKINQDRSFGVLKSETGIHRLVRNSPFNKSAKRHTSFASVLIYPVISKNTKYKINNEEIRIDTYRASGAGGQHVNTTDSAVRITHLPTKITVQCQNHRSQHKNKESCLSLLQAKIFTYQEKKISKNTKKNLISWGNQIRSYVLDPYKLVKDIQTGIHTYNVKSVLDGNLDIFIYRKKK